MNFNQKIFAIPLRKRFSLGSAPRARFFRSRLRLTLSKGKSSQNTEEIHYENLLQHYKKLKVHLTKKSTIKVIKHWQKVLAILNVKTLQDHAKLSNSQPWAKYLFGSYILTDERNRPCLPSFYASKVIYDLLLSSRALIGLQVNLSKSPNTI